MSPRAFLEAAVWRDCEQGLSIEDAERNAFIRMSAALDEETPAKRWFHAEIGDRAPIYRALRINPQDGCACYATTPFRLYRNEDEEWRIFAAWPAPKVFAPDGVEGWLGDDWLGIETVIEWDPRVDNAKIVGDREPQLVGNLNEGGVDGGSELFASPRAFFQAWAMRRAQYQVLVQTTTSHWTKRPAERDEVPGALVVGDLAKVRWNPATLPAHIECHGIDPQALNRAILRAARLPRASAANTLRSAA